MKVGTLSRRLGQIGRVNHCLGDFLLARDDHVGAEAPQVLDLRIAVGARENADPGIELARDLDDPTASAFTRPCCCQDAAAAKVRK